MNSLLDLVDNNRLELFEERYSTKYFDFACHAAIPRIFTTDLLYKIWLNFQKDQANNNLDIPLTVVAELISTPICKQIGQDLFEFYPDIRIVLTRALLKNERFGPTRKEQIADFIQAYVEFNPNKIPSLIVREALLFEAKSILDPIGAINDLMEIVRTDLNKETPNKNRIKKTLDFIENKNKSIPSGSGTNPWQLAKDLVQVLQFKEQGKINEAVDLLTAFKKQLHKKKEAKDAISIALSEEVLKKLELDVQQQNRQLRRLHVLMVGINEYDPKSDVPPVQASLDTCKRVEELLLGIYKEEENKLSIRKLENKEATRNNVISTFERVFSTIEDQDICLFLFSGRGSFQENIPSELHHAYPSKKMKTLVCYDSRVENGKDLYEVELSYLVWKCTQEKEVQFICLLDN